MGRQKAMEMIEKELEFCRRMAREYKQQAEDMKRANPSSEHETDINKVSVYGSVEYVTNINRGSVYESVAEDLEKILEELKGAEA